MIEKISKFFIYTAERGLVPDVFIRWGIRNLCRQRLKAIDYSSAEELKTAKAGFIEEMHISEVAPVPEAANEQHYELPPEFFDIVLGKYRKYSCCYWPEGTQTLSDAEFLALETTCNRAELADGQDILELGCGWGSLTLFMAETYPSARIVAVSNSNPQREFIEKEARNRRLDNIKVITADMNSFDTEERFDRVVSIEMFEHMRNYRELLQRVSSWLHPSGKMFVHVFCHKNSPYRFEANGAANWMARYFFTGGIMPSDDLFTHFQDSLHVRDKWCWDGIHYQKTAEAWLENLDREKDRIMPILVETYGGQIASQWFNRWRMFFLACAETFGFNKGQEWWVVHYLMEKPITTKETEMISGFRQSEPLPQLAIDGAL